MDEWRQQRIVGNRNAPRRNPIWLFGLFAIALIALALGGSYFTSNQINKAADTHGSSAGRSGDAMPNGIQEQQNDPSARGPSTTGANHNTAVPPATGR